MKKQSNLIKYLVVLFFIAMVAINSLANILPLNGNNTGQISDSYPNLFAPAGFTFLIWSVIYLLLVGYCFYQFKVMDSRTVSSKVIDRIGIVFIISCLANMSWIFAWHYRIIPLSMVLTLTMLVSIIYINKIISKEKLSAAEKILLKLPFSVYFGWLTVATIANATVLLVSWNWNGFGIAASVWMTIILIVGIIIGAATTIINTDVAYGLVFVWAYSGILYKHVSKAGFGFEYPVVVYTVIACIVAMVLAIVYSYIRKQKK